MNKLILCEGETDAILLSYYLEKTVGWEYVRKGPKDLSIQAKNENETVNWYRKNGDFLLICAVGGKDNFGRFWHERIAEPLINANAFEKIAIVTDRDLREISEIERQMKECLSGIQIAPHHDKWVDGSYCDTFKINRKLSVLLLIIPKEHQGALETVMLDAISENDYDRVIVNKTYAFSKEMQKVASKYISSDRLRLKAHLGLTWAVQFPEKVFTRIDEQIRNVEWEKSDILKDCFSTLQQI